MLKLMSSKAYTDKQKLAYYKAKAAAASGTRRPVAKRAKAVVKRPARVYSKSNGIARTFGRYGGGALGGYLGGPVGSAIGSAVGSKAGISSLPSPVWVTIRSPIILSSILNKLHSSKLEGNLSSFPIGSIFRTLLLHLTLLSLRLILSK